MSIKYWGLFDRNGVPQGFYNDDIFPEGKGVPSDAVEVTEDQWKTFINNQNKRWNGTDVVDYVPTITKEMLLSYASDKKKTVEQGGITINGFSVATDRSSQAMISQTVLSLTLNPNLVMNWRNPDGSFSLLTGDFIKTLAYYVSLHVSNSFTALANVTGKINDGTLKTNADIDAFFSANVTTAFTTQSSNTA